MIKEAKPQAIVPKHSFRLSDNQFEKLFLILSDSTNYPDIPFSLNWEERMSLMNTLVNQQVDEENSSFILFNMHKPKTLNISNVCLGLTLISSLVYILIALKYQVYTNFESIVTIFIGIISLQLIFLLLNRKKKKKNEHISPNNRLVRSSYSLKT